MDDAISRPARSGRPFPARLDRLPWSRFHWMIIIGLGTAWILDGLEVNVVGAISGRLSEHGAGTGLTKGDVSGWAASLYIAGACFGALLFGELTDRFGRKRLFMLTLGDLPARHGPDRADLLARLVLRLPLHHRHGHRRRVQRDQLGDRRADPRKHRGRVDISINGSYWLGGVGGSLLAVLMLNTRSSPPISAGGCRSCSARSSAWGCCSSAETCRRAHAGCSSTAASRRPRRSSKTSKSSVARRPASRCRSPRASR